MAIRVQKFGGTSVGSIERIQNVARQVLEARASGDQVVVVSSAMSGETNRLIELALQIHPQPYSREYDMLLASGEQVAVSLLSLAINTQAGREVARPFLGHQVGIKTNRVFSKARIEQIDTDLLESELSSGRIPVIAGFQGVDSQNNITTLGRGGSDTSAVALAAALRADVCEIFTDVDGIYTTDPRLCSKAKKIRQISYEEMMELSSLGAKVLQIRSVELAAKFKIPIHVRSSFENKEGTQVMDYKTMEKVLVAGVAADRAQVKFTLQNLPSAPAVASRIFKPLSEANIVVDVIVLDAPSQNRFNVSFTVARSDASLAKQVLGELQTSEFREMRLVSEENLAKVSIVGVGMQHHPGVASKMFELLASQSIDIKLVTTSEIKTSCLIAEEHLQQAVECLHNGFELDRLN